MGMRRQLTCDRCNADTEEYDSARLSIPNDPDITRPRLCHACLIALREWFGGERADD